MPLEITKIKSESEVPQSCQNLSDAMDYSPTDSSVHGIFQARTLDWVAISFSNAWNWKVKVKSLNRVRLLVTTWTAAHQAPLSLGFSRQEYWSGVPLPSPIKIKALLKSYNVQRHIAWFPKKSLLYSLCFPTLQSQQSCKRYWCLQQGISPVEGLKIFLKKIKKNS